MGKVEKEKYLNDLSEGRYSLVVLMPEGPQGPRIGIALPKDPEKLEELRLKVKEEIEKLPESERYRADSILDILVKYTSS